VVKPVGIGVDTQASRTMIALAEGAYVGMVGDGTRWSVPNAVKPGKWASAAVDGPPDGDLLWWHCDPWSVDFLRGLSARLTAYVGLKDLSLSTGYTVTFVAAANTSTPWRDVGLSEVTLVHPLDALMCRRLTERTIVDTSRPVVAVACGETSVWIGAYRVTGSGKHVKVVPLTRTSMPADTRKWSARLARHVLDRCANTESVQVLALLDAVAEFGAQLWECPGDHEMEWGGVLSDQLFSPVRFSRDEMAKWPEVESVMNVVTEKTATVVADHTDPLIVLGGVGAVWPFLKMAVSGLGPVWRSGMPDHDLAVGAARWHEHRSRFSQPVGISQSPTPVSEPEPVVPPWKRP
jgi:hypothetical protein